LPHQPRRGGSQTARTEYRSGSSLEWARPCGNRWRFGRRLRTFLRRGIEKALQAIRAFITKRLPTLYNSEDLLFPTP
jgi:hypothetical protein